MRKVIVSWTKDINLYPIHHQPRQNPTMRYNIEGIMSNQRYTFQIKHPFAMTMAMVYMLTKHVTDLMHELTKFYIPQEQLLLKKNDNQNT